MSTSKPNEPAMMTPDILAQEILSVQPIANMINPFAKKWVRVGIDGPTNKWVFNIRLQEIRDWIEEQPIHMWKHYEVPQSWIDEVSINAFLGQNYIFTEEMEAWFQLRWS